MMLFAQYLPSALSKAATRYLRNDVFVVLDDFLTALRTLLSARVSNVALPGVCRFWPKSWRMSFFFFDFDATVEWVHVW